MCLLALWVSMTMRRFETMAFLVPWACRTACMGRHDTQRTLDRWTDGRTDWDARIHGTGNLEPRMESGKATYGTEWNQVGRGD